MSAIIPFKYSQEQYKSLDLWYQFIENTYQLINNTEYKGIPENSSQFAVFVDNRQHPHLDYVLRNVMHFLGPEWGLQIFVWPENRAFVERIVNDWHHVHITEIPNEIFEGDPVDAVKRSVAFWERVKGDKQLFFDINTLLCNRKVDDFLNYDYIGAPWLESHAVSPACRIGSGGLSIRRKNAMMEICQTTNTRPVLIAEEDIFFSVNMHLKPDNYRLPTVETAQQFAVEGIFHPSPFGLHRPWVCLPVDQLRQLLGTIDYSND